MDWNEFFQGHRADMRNLFKGDPELMRGLRELGAAGRGKALDGKTRELIAMAVAVTTRCDGCIATHAAEAAKAGASREELLETLAVAVSLNAGAASVYSAHALAAFDQIGGAAKS